MKKVIGLGTSSRAGGNTDILLAEALRGAHDAGAEVENIHLAGVSIGPCLGCRMCEQTGQCVVKDQAPALLEKIWTADAVIFSTPIYFMGPPSHFKALIDRGQSLWVRTFLKLSPEQRKAVARRPALLMMVGGLAFANMFDPTAVIVRAFCVSAGLELKQTLTYKKVDEAQAIRHHPTAMDEAYQAGRSLVE